MFLTCDSAHCTSPQKGSANTDSGRESGTLMLPPSKSITITSINCDTSCCRAECTPIMKGVGVDSTWGGGTSVV